MVDDIHNVISTLFHRRESDVDPICILNLFKRRFNLVKRFPNVGSTLNQSDFGRWESSHNFL